MTEMLRRLEHRGRDHCGMAGGVFDASGISRKDVALGHRRLSIIDLSEEADQPMSYDAGRLWLAFNGEIYNYLELRASLKAEGFAFKTDSDTEVVLAAYDCWGDSCVEHLNGMFSFALWDVARERLFCARDHLGIKPFYYIHTDEYFVFASESKALQPYHGNRINQDSLAAYLLALYIPSDWSIFAGVKKLLPGHFAEVKPSSEVAIRRYWCVEKFADVADTSTNREALERVLRQSISRQLRSDVPVGALLSGGVDSGMIVALASQERPELHTYSVGFEGLAVNELSAAADVAARYKTQHHEALITGRQAIDYLDKAIAHHSEPIADPAIVPSYVLSGMAAGDGVKVLLSGTGGDEIFGGYERYAGGATMQRRLLSRFPESVRRMAGCLFPASSKMGARLKNSYLDMMFTTSGNFDLCAGKLADDQRLTEFLARLAASFPIPSGHEKRSLLYKQMGFDMHVYLPDELLFLFDQMTMAHTIEGRVPLLDVQVTELAFRFPESSHVRGEGTKILFREIAEDFLGHEHVWRKKQGFAGPVPWWVGENSRLFSEVALSACEIPGMEMLRGMATRLADQQSGLGLMDSHAVFILYCLRRWYDSLQG
ncbi:MAG: asparagine synthase (glutamine-hydrolyzing) [Zetaproteobacteria bacterium CG1_02_55_237]|nr:MAG: asparagine synthase (glutamine-hydrolyzing) [Zetaproteobacteria bacterium CG1_02_55_237]